MLSRLLQALYERLRFTTRWWAAFRVKSFKAAVINLQVHGTLLIYIQNGRQSAYNPYTADLQVMIGLLPFVVDALTTVTQHVGLLTDGGQSKTDLRHLRMCCVRTRSKHKASSQNSTRKTSHMLNIPYNFLNGFERISKMTCGTS